MSRIPSYDIGDATTLYVDFTDADGVATNPTAVTLTITLPDATTVTKTTVQLTNPSVGRWEYVYTFTLAGNYVVNWAGTGAIVTAVTRRYYVRQAGEMPE